MGPPCLVLPKKWPSAALPSVAMPELSAHERVLLPDAGPARVFLTQFYGREPASAELGQILEACRLVTLVGAPGGGKTRLGVELGNRLADRYASGVVFVELAPVADPSLVASALAGALGVRDQPDRSVEDAVVERLASAELLLVLDNCEHVVEAAADLVARLLAGCPSLRVLATSRIALDLGGEQVWRVPPLDLGAAVELFMDRAELATSRIGVDPPAAGVVERICERLDGLPLAIELAAAWTWLLTPVEILRWLDHVLPLLRSHVGDGSRRQQTMEATVDWSYQLLKSDQRRLFARLSVFAGGFDLEAAQAVAPGEDVLVGLAALIDHSLVVAESASSEVMRYRLLEPVRQCAEAQLSIGGERDATCRRHAEHYLDVAARLDAELRSGSEQDGSGGALSRLERETANCRLALAWARDQPNDLGLRLCTALATAWVMRGHVNEGRAWMDEMLDRRPESGSRQLRAHALDRAGELAWRQLDYPSTRAHLDAALAIDRESGDPLGEARRLRGLAMVAGIQDHSEEADRLYAQSTSLLRRHGDQRALCLTLSFRAAMLQAAGETERAEPYMREALELNRASSDIVTSLYCRGALSNGAMAAGDMAGLRAHITEVACLLRRVGVREEDAGWVWWNAAALASGEGRYASALRLAGAAEAIVRRGGLPIHGQTWRQALAWIDRARAHVGPAKADQHAVEGAQLTFDELLHEVLDGSPHPGNGPLSPRELEIACLIARGLTNSEIATHLAISKRTVESHVDHIKGKLGFARRARIVTWALEQDRPQ